MVSNQWLVGVVGSVERCFVLCWWHVCAVAVEPVVVEPVNPAQGGELELADVVPSGRVGSVDAFGLVQPVGRLGQGIDAPIDRQVAVSAVGGVEGWGRCW